MLVTGKPVGPLRQGGHGGMVQDDELRLPFTPSEPGDIFPKCIGSKVTAYDAFPNHSRIPPPPCFRSKAPTLEKSSPSWDLRSFWQASYSRRATYFSGKTSSRRDFCRPSTSPNSPSIPPIRSTNALCSLQGQGHFMGAPTPPNACGKAKSLNQARLGPASPKCLRLSVSVET